MPTIYREDGYRFSFWSNENNEPPHIHVTKAEGYAKYWLDPVDLVEAWDFNPSQMRRVGDIVREQATYFLEKWHEFFGA